MEILLLFGNIAYSGLLINCSYCFLYPDHAITPCPTAKHIKFVGSLILNQLGAVRNKSHRGLYWDDRPKIIGRS